MMNRERQNRFYGSLPGPVPSGFMRHEASHASSGTRNDAAGDTIPRSLRRASSAGMYNKLSSGSS